jgi:myosin heavy subunit
MKKAAGLLALLALLLVQVSGAFAQSSDYETIDSYKKRHRSLLQTIKEAQALAQRDQLEKEIVALEESYRQHRILLGEGLYPESFEASVAALREQLGKTSERLLLVEERRKDKVQIAEIGKQNEEYRASIEALTRDVTERNARIQQLTEENAGLQGTIKALQLEGRKDKESIAKLQELTARLKETNDKLRDNIRDRDELVVKLMDNLFDGYARAGLTDAGKKDQLAIAQDHDYVSKIVTTLDGNIAFVETTLLTPQDVRQIRDQQQQISGKWDQLKPYVGKLYPDDQTKLRDISAVDGRLSTLKTSTAAATWKSIHQVFAAQNVVLEPFGNAGDFHARVSAYIDAQLKHPSRERYQLFRRRIWDSPLKDQWLPLIPTDELTAQQRSDIEARLALWDRAVSALFWRWVLAGVLGAAIVVAVVVVVSRRKRPVAPA